jgi:hypothetical protein
VGKREAARALNTRKLLADTPLAVASFTFQKRAIPDPKGEKSTHAGAGQVVEPVKVELDRIHTT